MNHDLKLLKSAYLRGENISQLLKQNGLNTIESIEYAYDLQAGSYVRAVSAEPERFRDYTTEMADIISKYAKADDEIIDCGCGELTTLAALSHKFPANVRLLAFDISVSRIMVGRRYARTVMRTDLAESLAPFVAAINRIPLPDRSVDIVLTSHALEPNHGEEKQLLSELIRICKRKLILFEPSWELGSSEARTRMGSLGYVRELPIRIIEAGGVLSDVTLLTHSLNPLNPTAAYIIDPPKIDPQSLSGFYFVCPKSRERLNRYSGYYWSSEGGYAYPDIEGVPVLKESNAILMCQR